MLREVYFKNFEIIEKNTIHIKGNTERIEDREFYDKSHIPQEFGGSFNFQVQFNIHENPNHRCFIW